MAPLIVNVTGTSTIERRAERAAVSLHVSSTGESQSQVTSEVTRTAVEIQTGLRELARKDTSSDGPAAEAAVTNWSMSTLSTGSYIMWLDPKKDGEEERQQRMYSASTSFEIKFADFEKLGQACGDLASLPFVAIRNIAWSLSKEMDESLNSQSRRLAVEDAIEKARDFAVAAGKTEVTVVEITGNETGGFGGGFGAQSTGVFRRERALIGRGESELLNFEPGMVEKNCSVSVKFEAI